ncbi:MAG: nucleotide exchange factor GrpE [Verrucomicrobia bacterium]|nr:nucleotide exchange factor GrpE [Verrucomicrobiota bacterium]
MQSLGRKSLERIEPHAVDAPENFYRSRWCLWTCRGALEWSFGDAAQAEQFFTRAQEASPFPGAFFCFGQLAWRSFVGAKKEPSPFEAQLNESSKHDPTAAQAAVLLRIWNFWKKQYPNGLFRREEQWLRDYLQAASQTPFVRDEARRLVELLDRMRRLNDAFHSAPRKRWWQNDGSWRQAWETQRQGSEILITHAEALLKEAGVTRFQTLQQPFDPTVMTAVATERAVDIPPQTVIEELAPGYRLRGELLRVAQVKVSL